MSKSNKRTAEGIARRREYRSPNRQANKRKHQGRLLTTARRLKSKPCADCGATHPYYVMQFDHRPGEQKFNRVNKIRSGGRLVAEIAKCDVVCANCHAARTYFRQQVLA